jgi:hypothetical protein
LAIGEYVFIKNENWSNSFIDKTSFYLLRKLIEKQITGFKTINANFLMKETQKKQANHV